MHIVYVSREYPPSKRGGGIASYIKEMATSMAALGHQVTVVAASDDTRLSSDSVEEGVRVIRLNGGDFVIPEVEGNSKLKKLRPLYRFWSYRRKVRETVMGLNDVDVIEVPEYGVESLYLHGIGIPVVVRLHTPALMNHYDMSRMGLTKRNLPFYIPQLYELKEIARANYVSSCSASLKEWCEKYAGLKEGIAKVIWNPIKVDESNELKNKTSNTSKTYIGSNTKHDILFAGTVCDWKGCGDLCETGQILANDGLNSFKISFVGKTGAYAEMLKEKYGHKPWFDLVGKVAREELMERYRKADVVVFPSWWENMPMVCLEAMSQGAIVIGSSSGGMSEIIEDGVSGWLVEPRSPRKIAAAIRKAHAMTNEERENMSSAAQMRIKEYFSTEVICREMEQYFEEVINNYKKTNKR